MPKQQALSKTCSGRSFHPYQKRGGPIDVQKDIQDCDYVASQVSNKSRASKVYKSLHINSTKFDIENETQRQDQRSNAINEAKPKKQIVDLTIGTEQCCLCPNVLGEGGDLESAIYVFHVCGCVICGECVGEVRSLQLWCPKCNHLKEPQNVQKLVGIGCSICYESSGIDAVVELIYTQCSHVFCRSCMESYLKEVGETSPKCPCCRTVCVDGLESGKFYTTQRGVDIIE